MTPTNKLLDLPKQALPRERLINSGRGSLTDAELVAIFLRTGIPGKNVLQLSQELITAAGSLNALAQMEAPQMVELFKGKGIGAVKAATLSAAFELGTRALREKLAKLKFTSSSTIYDYLSSFLRWQDTEILVILMLNSKCELIKHEVVSKGTLSNTLSHPRNIFRSCIVHNAHSFILAHNHPSGNPAPSAQDDLMTEQIAEASKIIEIHFRDHIIIGCPTDDNPKNFYSYFANGRLP